MDKKYRQIAERALHSEFAYALGISADKVDDFIKSRKNDD